MSERLHPQYTNIFNLINEVFSDETLFVLLYDTPELQRAYYALPTNITSSQTIRHLITFAEKNNLFEFLLRLLNAQDATAYERHQPYFGNAPTEEPNVQTSSVGNIDAMDRAVGPGASVSNSMV